MEFVLAIALITWGGVFFYILRVERLTRSLERDVAALTAQMPAAPAEDTPLREPIPGVPAREHLNI